MSSPAKSAEELMQDREESDTLRTGSIPFTRPAPPPSTGITVSFTIGIDKQALGGIFMCVAALVGLAAMMR